MVSLIDIVPMFLLSYHRVPCLMDIFCTYLMLQWVYNSKLVVIPKREVLVSSEAYLVFEHVMFGPCGLQYIEFSAMSQQ